MDVLNEIMRAIDNGETLERAHELINNYFRFTYEHGSHSNTLIGIVYAIEISDEGGLELHVSNPRIWGTPLKSIIYNNGIWKAHVDIPIDELSDETIESMSAEEHENHVYQQIAKQFWVGEFKLCKTASTTVAIIL